VVAGGLRRSEVRIRPVLFLVFLLPFLPGFGCAYYRSFRAYYNTFYNARKLFDQAEEERLRSPDGVISRSAIALYDQAIRKASKVVAFYPQSGLVDDSLFLIGLAFYRKGDHSKAVKNFEELERNFPDSKFIRRSRYWQALCYWEMERYEKASEILNGLAEGTHDLSDDALFSLGKMAYERGSYPEALEQFNALVSRFPKSDLVIKAYFEIGETYLALEQFDDAIKAFQKAAKTSGREVGFRAKLKIGECLEGSGRFKEALDLYRGLLDGEGSHRPEPEVVLRMADCYARLMEIDRALEGYRKVAEDYPKTRYAAQAYYQMGMIYQRTLDSLSLAKDYFNKARSEDPRGSFSAKAEARSEEIDKLESYRKAKTDSPDTAFLLAELYLFDLSQPDSALTEYKRILDQFPGSKFAPKAAYAIGWIFENVMEDSMEARGYFEKVLKEYPESPYAEDVRRRLGVNDPARKLFLEAEDLRLAGVDPQDYLMRFEEMIREYPQSDYAPKSEYVIAWTYENVLQDSVMAYSMYKRLAERYPDSEYGQIAAEKLNSSR